MKKLEKKFNKVFSTFDKFMQQVVIRLFDGREGVIYFEGGDYEFCDNVILIHGKKEVYEYVCNLIKSDKVSSIVVDCL